MDREVLTEILAFGKRNGFLLENNFLDVAECYVESVVYGLEEEQDELYSLLNSNDY